MFRSIFEIRKAKTGRCSSWDKSGRNNDAWVLKPGETRKLADIKGSGMITHIWMTQGEHYRDVLLKITWDDAPNPSILCPLGDFFCLGNGIVNSFQSALFTASTKSNNEFNKGCALNCYAPMPFRKHAVVELINESKEPHRQYFYIDYEFYSDSNSNSDSDSDENFLPQNVGYFHAEFHRENPFGGWGHEIRVNSFEANISNKERTAWDNNYVILETKGRGHYIGCNYSITNFQGTWWGEGDDMIWVDGYKWPPDLHGTGSEDYLNQAWCMQDNAFMRNGSSIFESNTGGYQTSYVFHLENPVRFEEEIKVTIEFGHGNHLRNEGCSVAYWYAERPTGVKVPPSVEKRQPVQKKNGKWIMDPSTQITSREIPLNDEMKFMKARWQEKQKGDYFYQTGILTETKSKAESEGEEIYLRMKISPKNPNYYDVPLEEIFEDYIGKNVEIEIVPKTAILDNEEKTEPDILKLMNLPPPERSLIGILEIDEQNRLIIKNVKGKIPIIDELQLLINKKIEIEVLHSTNIKIQIRYDQ